MREVFFRLLEGAARNEKGRVILYADSVSKAMEAAIKQTVERRIRQQEYNEK